MLKFLRIFFCVLWVVASSPLLALDELRVGLSTDIVTVDPHFANQDSVSAVCAHIYETLVALDPDTHLIPVLATSWRPINETTWEFKLRRDVKFHDGSPLTADDVAFSIDRPATLTTSSAPFTSYTKTIVSKKIIDPYTIQLTTAIPYPLLPNDLSRIFIVSKKAAQNASTEDFNLGKVEAGSGPFKLTRYTKGDSIQLQRNDAYWGDKPAWTQVTLKMLPNDSARMSALLSGDVQAIENVQANLVAQFRQNKKLSVYEKVSSRFMFIYLDFRDTTPYAVDKAGKPLAKNPLQDLRVRQAISKLIDRNVLAERVIDKLGVPNGNIAAPGTYGFSPTLTPETYDLAGAKRLLTEAGYPNGFGITFFAPNNRFINDDQVAQAIGQMLTRGGIDTKVQTMPMATYIPRAARKENGFGLLGWGVGGGEPSGAMRAFLATTDKEKGLGAYNWASYSNPRFDELLLQALRTVDDKPREKLLQQAVELAVKKDYAIIPLYNQVVTWATKKGIRYTPRTDEFTLAQQFHPE